MPRAAIKDEYSDLPISRQRKWQLRRARDGRCSVCGAPAMSGVKGLCVEHVIARREYQRERCGCKGRYLNCASYKAEAELAQAKVD